MVPWLADCMKIIGVFQLTHLKKAMLQKLRLVMLVALLNGCSHFEGKNCALSSEDFLAISNFDPQTRLNEIIDYVFNRKDKCVIQPKGMQLIVKSASGTVLQFEFKEYEPTYTREEIDELLGFSSSKHINRIFLPFAEDPTIMDKLTLADLYSMSLADKKGSYYSFKLRGNGKRGKVGVRLQKVNK